MYVVDANIALFWTIETPLSARAKSVLRSGRKLIAPDLILVEVTNALFMQIRKGLETEERAKDGIDLLPRWFSEIVPSATLRNRAFELSLKLQHPAYDCFYLALALMREVRFVTSDAHFQRKSAAAGYGESVVLLDDWADS